MKKSALLSTVGMLLLGSAVNAEITFYGQAHLSVDEIDNGADGLQQVKSVYFSSNSSRLGMKGFEEFAGDSQFVWQLEASIGEQDGELVAAARDNYLAFAVGQSTLLYGRVNTPFKNLRSNTDLFNDTIADARNIVRFHGVAASDPESNLAGTVGFDERFDGTVAYMAKIGRVGLSLATTLPEGDDPESVINSASLSYDEGGFFVGIAHESHGSARTLNSLEEGSRLAVRFQGENTKLNLFYQRLWSLAGVPGRDPSVYGVGLAQAMERLTLKAQMHVASDLSESNGDTGATQLAYGFDYRLSKSNWWYFVITSVENERNTQGFSLGGEGYGGEVPQLASNGDRISSMSMGYIYHF